jgi:hypothetical protein|nr:hypothetical protein MFMH1_46560 [Myxococcus sp. MH1]
MLNAEEVAEIAGAFIRRELGRELKPDPLVRKHPRMPDEWVVLFERRGEDGSVFDGPLMVLVHDATRVARFL